MTRGRAHVVGRVAVADEIRVLVDRPYDFAVGDRLSATDMHDRAVAFDVVAISGFGHELQLRRVRWHQRLWRWLWRRR